jgi:hypothetical protein
VDDFLDALETTRGFIARSDLLAVGLDDRFIRRQLQTRAWTRIRNGAYLPTARWSALDAEERHRRLARAVVHAHGDAVALSKVSGLLVRGGCDIWGLDLSRVHVTRRDGRSGSLERDVVHHQGVVDEADIELVNGLPVLSELRCVAETISLSRVEAGIVIADSALRTGRVTREQLESLAASMVRWRGSRTLDLVLRLADGRAQSVGESRSRFAFWSQGLPRPEVQYPVYEADGTLVGVTDLAWPGHRVLFEFDGRVKYGRLLKPGQLPGDVVFEEKRREDALRRATGFTVERAVWLDLSTPGVMARRVRQRMVDGHLA